VEIHGQESQIGSRSLLWSLSPMPVSGRVHVHATDITDRKRLNLYESILPVCSACGKVRDDTGKEHGQGDWSSRDWSSLEQYVQEHSDTSLSHTFCPVCLEEYRRSQGLRSGSHSSDD